MNPYKIDYKKLKSSKVIKDEKKILKLKLLGLFKEVTSEMTTEEIMDITGLDKSDVSRLRTFGIDRFTIDRLISILDSLGYIANIVIKPKKIS